MSTLENCKRQILALKALLEQESNFLKAGQLENLIEISSTKLNAMSSLERNLVELGGHENLDGLTLQVNDIRNRAEENGVILKSVLYGVKAAGERLNSLRHSDAKVGAYNRAGTKLFLAEGQIISEKRI